MELLMAKTKGELTVSLADNKRELASPSSRRIALSSPVVKTRSLKESSLPAASTLNPPIL